MVKSISLLGFKTGQKHQFLEHRRRNIANVYRGRDEAHKPEPWQPLTFHSAVWSLPEVYPSRNSGRLGQDVDFLKDSGCLFGALNTRTNISIVVLNNDKNTEPGPVTSSNLLLHWHDLLKAHL